MVNVASSPSRSTATRPISARDRLAEASPSGVSAVPDASTRSRPGARRSSALIVSSPICAPGIVSAPPPVSGTVTAGRCR